MGVEAGTAERAAGIVVIGGGHAGAQLCNGLAAAGLGQRVHLVCAEPVLPYQRPPLSKAFLKGPDEALQWHRPAEWFAEAGITVHAGDSAVAIDRAARRVTLASGRVLDYERLVLATGARPRSLPNLPAGLDNVVELRSAAESTEGASPEQHQIEDAIDAAVNPPEQVEPVKPADDSEWNTWSGRSVNP